MKTAVRVTVTLASRHPEWSRLGAGFTPPEARGDAVSRIVGALDTYHLQRE